MPKHLEPVNRGLWSAMDQAFLPEGALQTATNVFYKPGDMALSQAPGRQEIDLSGTVTRVPIDSVQPIYWDPGSVKVPGTPELSQLLLVSNSDQGPLGMATIDFTAGTAGTKTTTTTTPPSGNVGDYLARQQFDTAAMVDRDNQDAATWFAFGGGEAAVPERNLAISRSRYESEALERTIPVFQAVTYNTTAYTDITSNMQSYPDTSSSTRSQALLTVNHLLYMGAPPSTSASQFRGVEINIQQTPGFALTTTWEYWNGSAWTAFTPDFDGTLDWGGVGPYRAYVDFGTLDGWEVTQVNCGAVKGKRSAWWVRVKRTDTLFAGWQPPLTLNWINCLISNSGSDTQPEGQHFFSHGLPVATDGPLATTSATSGGSFDAQTYAWYWWTWYDANHNKEGAGLAGELLNIPGTASFNAGRFTFTVPSEVPPDATHVRFYRGTGSNVSIDQFPAGILLATVSLRDLEDTTHTFTDLGPNTNGGLTSTAFTGTDETQFALTTYPLVRVNLGGISTEDSRNGPPSTASTGDVFDESLVINDVTDPRKLRFSYPGSPHAFPGIFYINFDTKDSDRIVAVRSLGNTLAVFLDRSVWRVNWLPRSSDFSFERGNVADLVVPNFGAYGPWGVARFSTGQGPLLAWVGSDGIYATDNYTWNLLTPQIDWKATIGNPQSALLLNNPSAYRLECYYAQPGSSKRTHALYLHYHPTVQAGGFMPITQIQRPGGVRAAMAGVTDTGSWQVVTSDEATGLYYEGAGTRDEATPLATPMDIKTRELYLSGIGEDFKQLRTFAHVKPSPHGADKVVLVTQVEGTGPSQQYAVDTNSGTRRLEAPHQLNYGEYMTVRAVVNGAGGFSINALGVEFDPQGRKSRG